MRLVILIHYSVTHYVTVSIPNEIFITSSAREVCQIK